MMRWRWHVVLLLGVLLTVAGVLLSAHQSPAEKFGNCFPLAAGACSRIVIPFDTVLSANCTVGELMATSVTVTGCTTAPCLCICKAANTWQCGTGPV